MALEGAHLIFAQNALVNLRKTGCGNAIREAPEQGCGDAGATQITPNVDNVQSIDQLAGDERLGEFGARLDEQAVDTAIGQARHDVAEIGAAVTALDLNNVYPGT